MFGYEASMGMKHPDPRGGQFSSLTVKTRLLKSAQTIETKHLPITSQITTFILLIIFLITPANCLTYRYLDAAKLKISIFQSLSSRDERKEKQARGKKVNIIKKSL